MQSIRNFIENLKNTAEEYREIDAPVSSVHELTGAVYYLMQQKQNPAVMFNRVDENEIPVLTNLFSSRKRLALAVNTDEEKSLLPLQRKRESAYPPPDCPNRTDSGNSHRFTECGPYDPAGDHS